MRHRRWGRPVLAGAFVVAAVVASLLARSGPRDSIPTPDADATPAHVVRAYVSAVAARDFDTANAIDPRQDSDLGRFSRPMSMTDLELSATQMVGREAYVRFTADYHHSSGTLDDGQEWGYVLKRGADGLWHITEP